MRNVNGALRWLQGQVDSGASNWGGLCLSLAANAYGFSASGVSAYGSPSPSTWFSSGKIKNLSKEGDPPAGSLLIWTAPGKAGHIAIADGRGGAYTNLSNGRVGVLPIERLMGWGLEYRGWAPPAFPAGNYQTARGYDASAVTAPEGPDVTYNPNGEGPNWLAKFLYANGLRGDVLKTAWAIAMRESGGKPRIDNEGMNQNGTVDYGLFQINTTHAAKLKERFGWTLEDMRDPEKALKYFMYMSNGGKDLSAWNMGPNPYDPANSAYHTRLFQEQVKKFGRVARHLNLDVDAPASVDGVTASGNDRLSSDALAESYGFAKEVIMANKGLRELFQRAVDGQWDATKFTLELKNTKWYQSRTPYEREAWKMAKEGGTDWATRLEESAQAVREMATTIGAELTDAELQKLARKYWFEGWGEQGRDGLMQAALEPYIGRDGTTGGTAADFERQLRELADANGVGAGIGRDDAWFKAAARSVAAGLSAIQDWEGIIQKDAAGLFPAYAKQIAAGMTVREAASPYLTRMASVLELPPESVSLDDPNVKKATGRVSRDGAFEPMSLWDFELDLRKDPRWQYTRGANEEASGIASRVLSMFGFTG